MRVCLIGTSNSIYKNGYAAGIESHPAVSYFKKFSIGASPSIIIPYFVSDIDFNDYDVVIFETAINDRNYYKYGSIKKEQIREYLEQGIKLARKKGCEPALLLMPSRKAFDKTTVSGLIYSRVASEMGVILFDGFDYIQKLSEKTYAQVSDLFIDDFHVEKKIAFGIGRKLMESIVSKMDVSCYETVDISMSACNRVLRSTSIASGWFSIIREGDEIVVRLKKGDEIIGIAFNAMKTVGNIRLTGATTVVKKITTKYYNTGKELLLLISPITDPLCVSNNGEVVISIEKDDAKITEKSRFEAFSETVHDHSVLEISKLIVKRNKKTEL